VLTVGVLGSTHHAKKLVGGDTVPPLVLDHVGFERGGSPVGDFGQEEIVESGIGSLGLRSLELSWELKDSTKFRR
jgi:hypothetical protein